MFDLFSEQEKSWCEKSKVKVATPSDPDYPNAFRDLTFRPHVLTYIGHPVWNESFCISIVGSRNPSQQALNWMDTELIRLMLRRKFCIVSGGARGIDLKAHQLALRNKCPTIAFLPAGLMKVYPSSLESWIEPIVEGGGAVVSQFSPSLAMQKRFFLDRNRLIAAISPVTLVIEAKRRSGTYMTASRALELDRTVAVLPSFPSEAGLGGLDLIMSGGTFPIRDAYDLLTLIDPLELVQPKYEKDQISHPCRDGYGDFARTSETLKTNIESPIHDHRTDTNHHTATSSSPSVGDGTKTHSDQS